MAIAASDDPIIVVVAQPVCRAIAIGLVCQALLRPRSPQGMV